MAYPCIDYVLRAMDDEAGGLRYSQYTLLFEKGVYTKTIGELLTWLHYESDRKPAIDPHQILLGEMAMHLDPTNPDNQRQREGFVGIDKPTSPLVIAIILRFETEAIKHEAIGTEA
jgi:hypothetical protein